MSELPNTPYSRASYGSYKAWQQFCTSQKARCWSVWRWNTYLLCLCWCAARAALQLGAYRDFASFVVLYFILVVRLGISNLQSIVMWLRVWPNDIKWTCVCVGGKERWKWFSFKYWPLCPMLAFSFYIWWPFFGSRAECAVAHYIFLLVCTLAALTLHIAQRW